MGFAAAMGLISAVPKQLGQHISVIPLYAVLIPQKPGFFRIHSCKQRCSGGNTAGNCGIGTGKQRSLCCQRIKVRGANGWVSKNTQTVFAKLVAENQQNIGLSQKHLLLAEKQNQRSNMIHTVYNRCRRMTILYYMRFCGKPVAFCRLQRYDKYRSVENPGEFPEPIYRKDCTIWTS